jgi:hypothetical protein
LVDGGREGEFEGVGDEGKGLRAELVAAEGDRGGEDFPGVGSGCREVVVGGGEGATYCENPACDSALDFALQNVEALTYR